ncbi:hypothetical protein CaCOL14_006352 [Colletotrichum acutatum]|uniref:Uncharacterized protein n=2 Tax=Colletotrichum acutatum species complex TaxID=2707335 RepID=A0A010RXG7_9PEZI|nr:uncharacterized protein COL516b_007432 [Colletotrichum fioriniae]XP_060362423.1 uncharacterized protein BDZ83DRAFT_754399 [Colletotrichum acutatum]EXF76973.1 hypothetical protein CFIO01_11462 [Colletotrichum fioriniae PJ7]KAJ0301926.1 hypothetical protein COL516b_007432 [Colletotrichum fioriniae]KAJ0324184.1 hypothetical protein COL5a_007849 [Colletotrichum fioriniae]KAK1722368.1 hypothetical protein BDZ83DRAFT_754399 [Colletotrichum acutatum]
MLMALKGRRLVLLAAFVIVSALLIFSQSLYPENLSWSDISASLPTGSKSSAPSTKGAKPARAGTGRFHFLIAASAPNLQFCRALVSSTANRFGAPVIAGWNGTGENDAAQSHLAKIRVVTKYLEDLPESSNDDLFMMIDGYDVLLQFGPDVLIERYFKAAAKEDERIIQQLGPERAQSLAGPMGRHIFFGADKVCWPVDWRRPACWAVPPVPNMDGHEFGPLTNTGEDMAFNHPRWLNSGTIIGPIKEIREMFRATLDLINEVYNPEYEFRESDQFYMSDVWGLQELERIQMQKEENPDAAVMLPPEDGWVPELEPAYSYNFHIAMDYWSLMFQTWAGYGEWVDWRKFDRPLYSVEISQNYRNSSTFVPWSLHMQADGMKSLKRIFNTTEDETMGATVNELIRKSEFGANIVTKQTFPLLHVTGEKGALDVFWPRMWFFPYGRSLIRSAINWFQQEEHYMPELIDGRVWYPAHPYPKDIRENDGGAWSDTANDNGTVYWLGFDQLCAEHHGILFGED